MAVGTSVKVAQRASPTVRGPVVSGPLVRGPVVSGPSVKGPIVKGPTVKSFNTTTPIKPETPKKLLIPKTFESEAPKSEGPKKLVIPKTFQ